MLRNTYWIIAITASIGLVTAIACGSDSKKPDPTPAAQANPALTEVQAALNNFANLKNFRATFAAQNKSASGTISAVAFTYDVVTPDKYQLYTGPTAGITRVVGKETFSYDRAKDEWTLLTDYSGAAYEGYNRLFDAKTMTDISKSLAETATVTKGSTDTVEGKTCQLYVITDNKSGNKTDMCVADNLPLRFIYHTGELNTTAVFSNYNTNIAIDRPKTIN
ncbi:MAG TPA: hypothetical protein VJB57_01755 [Dehalococcoidia bacterium]|nr:hypothetical protein [Dehalococcoidia bacterium]